MPPKSKVSGSGKKSEGQNSPVPATPAAATPVAQSDGSLAEPALVQYGSGKPDKVVYDAEQAKVRTEIDALQAKLNGVKDKIALTSKDGPNADKRTTLRAELDSIRGQQGNIKSSRGRTLDQIKALQESTQGKVKDLQGARAKAPYKSVEEIDRQISNLERQVESGTMKLVDEKRALQEITQLKRSKRTVGGFDSIQEEIEKDRAKMDELRKTLDDPESKAISDRFEAIKAELDAIKKESDDAYAGRSKLFDERSALQGQLDVLYNRKRESAQRYKDANDKHWNKVQEERARRAERSRAERQAEDDRKRTEIADRLREEALAPAFQAQIEDCQTLIDFFSGKTTASSSTTTAVRVSNVDGLPELDLRKVEAPGEGLVARKKKGENDESYFVGKTKAGKKGNKGRSSGTATPTNGAAPTSSTQFNVPLSKLSALLSLSIPPPVSQADVPRTIEDLKTKKAWFEANQDRVTKENVAKAEKEINRLTGNKSSNAEETKADVPENALTPPNGGGENPAEPAPTPAKTDVMSIAPPSEEVVSKLDEVAEEETAQT